MQLTPWTLVALAVAGILAIALAVGDVLAPAKPPSCTSPRQSLDHGLTAQAQKGFAAVLEQHPTSRCAAQGMADVIERLCERAAALHASGAEREALATYRQVMAAEPTGPTKQVTVTEQKGSPPEAVTSTSEVAPEPVAVCAATGLATLPATSK